MQNIHHVTYLVLISNVLLVNLINAKSNLTHPHNYEQAQFIDASTNDTIISSQRNIAMINSSWEHSIISAHVIIQVLQQLLVASRKDFPFGTLLNDDTFRFVKYPSSFRATILQISQEAYKAFLSSHSTMRSIQLGIKQIPRHIKVALNVLAKDFSATSLVRILPQILNNINITSNDCVKAANRTRHAFSKVLKLAVAVNRMVNQSKSIHKTTSRTNGKENQSYSQCYQNFNDMASKSETIFDKTLNELPMGFKLLLKNFLNGMFDYDKATVDIASFACDISTIDKLSISPLIDEFARFPENKENSNLTTFGLSQTMNMFNQFINTCQLFQNVISKKRLNITEINSYAIVFKSFQNFIMLLPKNPMKLVAIENIERAINFTKLIHMNMEQVVPDNKITENVENDLAKYIKELTTFRSKNQNLNFILVSDALSRIDYEHFLDDIFNMHVKILKIGPKNNNEAILSMLNNIVDLFNQTQVFWRKFAQFLSRTTARGVNGINLLLKRFFRLANQDNDLARVMKTEINNQLKTDAFGILRTAYIFYIVSDVYYEVSTKYLMERLGNLSSWLHYGTIAQQTLVDSSKTRNTKDFEEVKMQFFNAKEQLEKMLNMSNIEYMTLIDRFRGQKRDIQDVIGENTFLND